jgi:hypothetical protein
MYFTGQVANARLPMLCQSAEYHEPARIIMALLLFFLLENSPVDYCTTMLTHLRLVTRITLAIVV